MSTSQKIGQKIILKYTLIGSFMIILTPLLIGFILFYVFDWPMNFGGKLEDKYKMVLILILILGISYIFSRIMGKWAGKKIIDEGQAPFPISSLALLVTFLSWFIITLNPIVLSLEIVVSLILAIFMGAEIKRKGELQDKVSDIDK